MSLRSTVEFRVGMMPANDAVPSRLQAGIKLYRGDLVFRGLVDLTLAGILVLMFSADWPALGRLGSSIVGNLSQSAPTQIQASDQTTVGNEIAKTLTKVTIDVETIARSGDPATDKLLAVATAANKGDISDAVKLLAGLDDRNPLTAYVKGAVIIRVPGVQNIAEAQLLLRRATSQSIFPAYILLGHILYTLLVNDVTGSLSADARVLVDDAGVVHPASQGEIAAAAAAWWERAAAFGNPEGLRFAGFAKARGLSGKVDLIGAASLWANAAQAGDALSQYELGHMLLMGIGIQPNEKEAIRLLRAASAEIPTASYALAISLVPQSIGGNTEAARTGIEAAEHAIERFESRQEKAAAHFILAQYLFQAAPVSLRNPGRAVDEFEKSLQLGNREAAIFAARGYELGIGKPKDLVCSYAFYIRAQRLDPARFQPVMERIAAEIGEKGVTRAKLLTNGINPDAGAMRGSFKTIDSRLNFKPAAKSETKQPWKSICDALEG